MVEQVKDGWLQVLSSGNFYWDFYDDGQFILRCTRDARDAILSESHLPLKLINSEIIGILTDF
jgi:hypothetical protein